MSSSFTIRQIFADHWSEFTSQYSNIRDVVYQEVDKMISCGDPKMGYAFYRCPDCGKYRFLPFRCHSRFCNSCGITYQQDRTASIARKMLDCRHRHIVFTIPESLRPYFRIDRRLLNCLFRAAAQVILHHFYMQNKSRHFRPGIVCALHTFGRDLKWNPHIHMLVTEYGIDKDGKGRAFRFFPYDFLRKAWMKVLLDYMLKALDPSLIRPSDFKRYKNRIYNIQGENGFYVHGPSSPFNSPDAVASYITRYIGRPVMAQSRITGYDGKNVSYWYQRHEDNQIVNETESALEFIGKLIIHIPDRGFNMLRYYGVYAQPYSRKSPVRRMLSTCQQQMQVVKHKWRHRIISSFGRDPLLCQCGAVMEFIDTYNPCNPTKAPPFMLDSA